MAIDSKNLLVWVKSMSRGQALPLDASEIYSSYAEAQSYAAGDLPSSAIAYGGQTIKALLDDGKYHSYMLQPAETGFTLEEIGNVKQSDIKQYVEFVDTLPDSAMEEGVLYICDTKAYVWTGENWKEIFSDVSSDFGSVEERIISIEESLEGTASKEYVDGLFANLEDSCATPGIVDSTNAIPTEYKAGNTYRVAEAGTYAGVNCEIGDLILVIKDYAEGTASNDDFLVIQANIDGAVTSTASTATVGEIVVFDSITGRAIKGSGIQIASLEDAINKAHKHENRDILDSFTQSQEDLFATIRAEIIDGLASKANSADVYTTTVIDEKLKGITDNLNTKISTAEVNNKINEATTTILATAEDNAKAIIDEKVGDIPQDTTIKSYIDTAIGTGGTSNATAIAQAKQEAIDISKQYTDEQIVNYITITEF